MPGVTDSLICESAGMDDKVYSRKREGNEAGKALQANATLCRYVFMIGEHDRAARRSLLMLACVPELPMPVDSWYCMAISCSTPSDTIWNISDKCAAIEIASQDRLKVVKTGAQGYRTHSHQTHLLAHLVIISANYAISHTVYLPL